MSERADFVLTRTPIGEVFIVEGADADGTDRKWIFIGWRRTTVGHEMVFVRSIKGPDAGDPWYYYASMADTLVKKFPGLERYRKQDDQG